MAELVFMHGLMGCGKSMLALSTFHNLAQTGRQGRLFTRGDRNGAVVSSRIGISRPAEIVGDDFDFGELAATGVDHVVCDEAQFLTAAQVDQLVILVDDHDIDVFAYGLGTDFRSEFFPGSRRLLEVADAQHELQLKAWCWCGQPARVNARIVAGNVVHDGPQVVIGDTDGGPVSYATLCRRHWRHGEHQRRQQL